ncbi:hypothetical protein KC332_g564 [Hortaea werneckii]|nr:hypothetical protein KC358_g3858 [Hortaea werneckii]KAI6852791.1 hypothetical protein KC350_g556 [Hortaea werneckii]KAI6943436.1 hypothetical protein KC341_g1490 [Hortaea werneckii]KAI6946621.1 hypothetical protein KC348_g3032 [Hortaea werneckii]KAI6983029.1 hypothetical protein KC321_g291 [Hortaea werneckii]
MVAPPDYGWCYNCVTRGCSRCNMMQTYPDPCTNCDVHFRNGKKNMNCKRSGITIEEWAMKKASEAQKLQQNAHWMFPLGQGQQGLIPMVTAQPGETNPKGYPQQQQQQQLPGSFFSSTPQLSAGMVDQPLSRNTLRAKRKRENNRRAKEEEMKNALAEAERKLEVSERKLKASEREREQMRDDERRVRRRKDYEVGDLRSSLRQEQGNSAGLQHDLKVDRTLAHQAQGYQNYTRMAPSQSYYPTDSQQSYAGQQTPHPPYQMPYGYPWPIQYPTQPPMQRPTGGHEPPPPGGDRQSQAYHGVEQGNVGQYSPGRLRVFPRESTIPMQQQVQSQSETAVQTCAAMTVFGSDAHRGMRQRAVERATARRNKPSSE